MEIKKLKATIFDLQQSNHEKNAQLKVDFDRITQLKQDNKILESEIIKAKSIIMKFEEEQKLKNNNISVAEKNKKRAAILKNKVETTPE